MPRDLKMGRTGTIEGFQLSNREPAYRNRALYKTVHFNTDIEQRSNIEVDTLGNAQAKRVPSP